MNRPTILITGASGQVGFELVRSLSMLGKVYAPNRSELDLSDLSAVEQWLSVHRPDLIVNPAAYTAVDRAEGEVDLCWRLNAELPSSFARYAAEQGATLVHFSSDYVYPGDGESPRHEAAPTGPLNVYGESKLAGDLAIMNYASEAGLRYYILRTSWVYSARGQNFLKTMLRLGQERDRLEVVNDQMGAPTSARFLANLTLLMLERELDSGVYHAVPRGVVSWCDFAVEIFRRAGELGWKLAIQPEQVQGVATSAYPTTAKRPLNSRLSVDKLEQALKLELPEWQEGLQTALCELR